MNKKYEGLKYEASAIAFVLLTASGFFVVVLANGIEVYFRPGNEKEFKQWMAGNNVWCT